MYFLSKINKQPFQASACPHYLIPLSFVIPPSFNTYLCRLLSSWLLHFPEFWASLTWKALWLLCIEFLCRPDTSLVVAKSTKAYSNMHYALEINDIGLCLCTSDINTKWTAIHICKIRSLLVIIGLNLERIHDFRFLRTVFLLFIINRFIANFAPWRSSEVLKNAPNTWRFASI